MHGSLIPVAGLALAGMAVATNPTLKLSNGVLHGGVCGGPNQNVDYFHSIPYAQAPIGNLRFQPPQAYKQQYPGGSRNATVAAPACPQFGGNWVDDGRSSEDCLFLNVWKPANTNDNSNLPVRVFIHGGGNTAGSISEPMYDGCDVAHDTVMVSINYRLGPLGFLALKDAGIAGNQGIQDIIQGLEWVQSNIAAFGGNPKHVVVHGQSNGAADAYVVATLDQAPKLMNAFVAQSGAGRDLPSANQTAIATKGFAEAVKCDIKDVNCFHYMSLEQISKVFGDSASLHSDALMDATQAIGRFSFGPYVDGKIIPKQPNEQAVRVPTIFGANADEGTMFAQAYATGPKGIAGTSEQDYQTYLKVHFGDSAKAVEQQYPMSNFKTTPYPPFFAISRVITDAAFICPMNRAMNAAAAKNVSVWTYRFAHTPHCAWDPVGVPEKDRKYMGATHGAEMPFILNMTSQLARPNGTCVMTDNEKKASSFLKQSLTYFAATRKPTKSSGSWQQWSPQKLVGLNIADKAESGSVEYKYCKFWDDLYAKQTTSTEDGDKPQSSSSSKPSSTSHSQTSHPPQTSSAPPTSTLPQTSTSTQNTQTSQTTGQPSSSSASPTDSATAAPSDAALFPTAPGNGTDGASSPTSAAPSSKTTTDPLQGSASPIKANTVGAVALLLGAIVVNL